MEQLVENDTQRPDVCFWVVTFLVVDLGCHWCKEALGGLAAACELDSVVEVDYFYEVVVGCAYYYVL